MIGIFARANHPEGYGYENRTAHGYSLLAVPCADVDELNAVAAKLAYPGLPEPMGRTWPWYGGCFDLVFCLPDAEAVSVMSMHCTYDARLVSLGDNRFAGIYSASELLVNNA